MELLIGAHDPEGRMIAQIRYLTPALELFDATITAVTPASVPDTRIRLASLGIEVVEGSVQLHETKLAAMRRSSSSVFCTELDKLLHYQRFFPEELEVISRINPEGFILLGRTQSAFDTYPESSRFYESIANREAAKVFGLNKIDVAVSDFIAERQTVDLLNAKLIVPGCECCVEMPADAILAGHKFKYIALDGFEWEDPDCYQEEIQNEGYEEWRRRLYDSAEEWAKREGQLRDYMRALTRFRIRLGLPIYPNDQTNLA